MIFWKILVAFRIFFFENYIFAWWNIWISIILLLPLKTHGHTWTIAFNPTFGSFTLFKTSFTLSELMFLVKMFRQFRLKQFFWVFRVWMYYKKFLALGFWVWIESSSFFFFFSLGGWEFLLSMVWRQRKLQNGDAQVFSSIEALVSFSSV